MSFVPNTYQQISLFDSLGFLSERKQRILDRSWAKPFSDHIFSNIDEMMFAPLYSDKRNSRPNAPVNVIVGALILKELNGLTDDEIIEECEFDFRYQYALHTTSFENQPLSDRTFSRFRERNAAYELTTGKDLIHDCISALSESICRYMDINPSIKRMDSMMIESNIRQMGRVELLYTCLANLVHELDKDDRKDLLNGLYDYTDPNNRNRVVYHDRTTSQDEKLCKIIQDAVRILPKCKEDYEQTDDYQLLQRAINEQTKDDGNGTRVPKTKEDGMPSDILQNPSDPDATYRKKAGKSHRVYSANIVETVDEKGSVITDYQYDVNTHSDASFIKEYLENGSKTDKPSVLITDGAYASEETMDRAAEKNIKLMTTGLLGRKPRKILGQFILDESGKNIVRCPAGNTPKSSNYMKQTDSIRNKYLVDKMPVRGKLRTKQFLGFKIAALNVSKLIRHLQGKLKCRAFEAA